MKYMVDNGFIEPIKLSPEDAQWYVDSPYEGAWNIRISDSRMLHQS